MGRKRQLVGPPHFCKHHDRARRLDGRDPEGAGCGRALLDGRPGPLPRPSCAAAGRSPPLVYLRRLVSCHSPLRNGKPGSQHPSRRLLRRGSRCAYRCRTERACRCPSGPSQDVVSAWNAYLESDLPVDPSRPAESERWLLAESFRARRPLPQWCGRSSPPPPLPGSCVPEA